MYILKYFSLVFIIIFLYGCGKSELDIEKERLRREADLMKKKIDSTQTRIDSAKKDLDSMIYRIKKDSAEIDSLVKKLTPFKK